jgi:hypothetical protein
MPIQKGPANLGTGVIETAELATNLVVTHALGSASTPSITFTGDTNTGIFSPTADTIAFAEGGAEVMRINSSGNVGIGTASPSTKLNIADSGSGVALQFNGYTGGQNIQAKIECERPNFNNFESQLRFYTHNGSSLAEKVRLDESGNLLVGLTSATSGGGVLQVSNGITFPATQVASSNANTLDDYEEGTWTATYSAGTIGAQNCTYTKIGRMVTVNFQIQWTASGTSLGQVGGLPFNISTINYMATHSREWYNTGKTTQCIGSVGSAIMDLFWYDNTRGVTNASIYGISGTIVYNVS